MALSAHIYTGNGTNQELAVNFALGYLSQDDVHAYVDGESTERTIVWLNAGLIKIGTVATGTQIMIRREVTQTQLAHDFENGASMIEAHLDESHLQPLMVIHEIYDGFRDPLSGAVMELNMGGFKITNLGYPETATDAATMGYVTAIMGLSNDIDEAVALALAAQYAAEESAVEANGSALAADVSRAAAVVARVAAEAAETAADGYRIAASGSASTANSAASAASTSEAAAMLSEQHALTSEQAAAASAQEAADTAAGIQDVAEDAARAEAAADAAELSELNAGTSESNAAASASDADISAGASSTSAGFAASQASAASGSASTATTQAGYASDDAASASSSASTATTQAGIATTQASNSATSAGQAASSAGDAATAKGLAEQAASGSQASAMAAQGHATSADTSEYYAGLSANAASGSASSASDDATAASTSAGFAAAGADAAAGSASDASGYASDANLSAFNANLSKTSAAASATEALGYAESMRSYKNKIINGNFSVAQRALAQNQTDPGYSSIDRWGLYADDATCVLSQVTENTDNHRHFAQVNVTATGGSNISGVAIYQHIEYVTTLAAKTVVLTFEARCTTAGKSIAAELGQLFGTGGSTPIEGLGATSWALTTTWQKFTLTYTLPSTTSKTITSDSALGLNIWCSAGTSWAARTDSLGVQTGKFQVRCVQLEEAVATTFEERSYSLELLLCQRYYAQGFMAYNVDSSNPTLVVGVLPLPTIMRDIPSFVYDDNIGNVGRISDIDTNNIVVTGGQFIPTQYVLTTYIVAAETLTGYGLFNWYCDAEL